jgi:hypothetical protein
VNAKREPGSGASAISWAAVRGGRGGNDEAGFEIAVSTEPRILRVRAWGLWSVDIAEGYREGMMAAFRVLRGRPWDVLSDRRRTLIQSEPVRAIMSDVMDRATTMGRRRAAVLVTAASAKLQMSRLAAETRVVQRQFEDENDALDWLIGARG